MKYSVEVFITRSYRRTVQVEADDRRMAGLKAEKQVLKTPEDTWIREGMHCDTVKVEEA